MSVHEFAHPIAHNNAPRLVDEILISGLQGKGTAGGTMASGPTEATPPTGASSAVTRHSPRTPVVCLRINARKGSRTRRTPVFWAERIRQQLARLHHYSETRGTEH
uniref:Uncharacterized protein n=1 Tax=Anopheles coluzzii TaxID=1518534 RepID=A0A8W7P3M1_ANOCL